MRARIRAESGSSDGTPYHAIMVEREGAATKHVALVSDPDGWVNSVGDLAIALRALADNLEEGS